MKSKNYAIKFLLSIVAIGAPFYPAPSDAIPVFYRSERPMRLVIRPLKEDCNQVEVKLISNSPRFEVYPSKDKTGAYVILIPAEAILQFDNGKTVREMGLYRSVGNWNYFESKSVTMGAGTGGQSVHYQDKLICYFDKNTSLEDLKKYRGF